MSESIRVLVIDDHPIVREGIVTLLDGHDDVEVVGQAGTLAAATAMRGLPVDVIVLDVVLPDGDGVTAIPRLRRTWPGSRVLVLSMQPEVPYAARSIEAGASGYVAKGSAPSELMKAVRAVAGGRRHLSASARESLSRSNEPDVSRLSPRELDVLRRLADGESVTTIAEALAVSVKTVSTFKSRIHLKLRLDSFAELVRFADENGISTAPQARTGIGSDVAPRGGA